MDECLTRGGVFLSYFPHFRWAPLKLRRTPSLAAEVVHDFAWGNDESPLVIRHEGPGTELENGELRPLEPLNSQPPMAKSG